MKSLLIVGLLVSYSASAHVTDYSHSPHYGHHTEQSDEIIQDNSDYTEEIL